MAEEEVHLNSMAIMMSNFSLVIYYSFLKKKKKNRREKTIQMEKFSIREDLLEGGFPPPYT